MTEQREIKHVGYTLADGVFTGTVARWWHVGPLLVQVCEVREVRFTDARPSPEGHSWWTRAPFVECDLAYDHTGLPSEWFPGTKSECFYPLKQDALADASQRAIAWARKEAGL